MNSIENKTSLIRYICAADSLLSGLTLVGEDIIFEHEEANVKLSSYLLHASPHKKHIQVLGDDTDIIICIISILYMVLQSNCQDFHEEI